MYLLLCRHLSSSSSYSSHSSSLPLPCLSPRLPEFSTRVFFPVNTTPFCMMLTRGSSSVSLVCHQFPHTTTQCVLLWHKTAPSHLDLLKPIDWCPYIGSSIRRTLDTARERWGVQGCLWRWNVMCVMIGDVCGTLMITQTHTYELTFTV